MANKVILIGRTGEKPELTFTGDQVAVLSFSIATNECWKDKESGERRERTEWHRCFMMGKRAEALAEHMEKGRKYYVEGKLETSKYEKDGQTHYATRVRVVEVEFV
jgi:single-strand DNA-binding protein